MSWVGTVPGWITLGLLAAAAWTFRKGGGGTAVSELERAGKVMERRIHELTAQVEDLERKLATAEARTDYAMALAPVTQWGEAHEANAERRNQSLLAILEQIARHLGAEPE